MRYLPFLFIFSFSLAHGFEVFQSDKSYEITTISRELSGQHGVDFRISAIVVGAEERSDAKYMEQWNTIESIDTENYQLIYVSAIAGSAPNKSGYYTAQETAKNILSGSNFVVIIYSPEGKVLVRSNEVLSNDDIIKYLLQP